MHCFFTAQTWFGVIWIVCSHWQKSAVKSLSSGIQDDTGSDLWHLNVGVSNIFLTPVLAFWHLSSCCHSVAFKNKQTCKVKIIHPHEHLESQKHADNLSSTLAWTFRVASENQWLCPCFARVSMETSKLRLFLTDILHFIPFCFILLGTVITSTCQIDFLWYSAT